MTIPQQYQLLAMNVFINTHKDDNYNVDLINKLIQQQLNSINREFDLKFKNNKRNYNLNAKPYHKKNNNSNYIKGINPNMNACGSRTFNGCSNKSYKKN